MKAIRCHHFAPIEQLSYDEVPDLTPQSHELVVKVIAAGVNFPDGLLVQGKYQSQPAFPFTPGTEVVGEIIQLGDSVQHLKPGQRVIAMARTGGYAEQMCVPAQMAMPIPDEIPSEEGAGLVTAHATAHHALKQRAQLQAGEILLVTGAAGGTGSAAVQIGKAMGATVIALCSSKQKAQFALGQGADHTLLYDDPELKNKIKALSDGKGVDVVYDVVGGSLFDTLARSMAWQGRLLVVGFASGTIPKLAVNLALVKGFSVVGVFWGTFTQKQPEVFMRNMQELVQWYLAGKVKVHVDQVFPLRDASQALLALQSRESMGKVVLVP